jgi:hypothetical protein
VFGLFSRRPSKEADLPAEVVTEGVVEIDAAPAAVFEHLHPASPRNALIGQGYTLSRRANGTVAATHPEMPETVLILEHVTATPPERLAFRARFEGSEPVGNLKHADSMYVLEPANDGGCVLRIREKSMLLPGIRGHARRRESQMLAAALQMHLMRLKMQVETGSADLCALAEGGDRQTTRT